jgi:hypothetical protein
LDYAVTMLLQFLQTKPRTRVRGEPNFLAPARELIGERMAPDQMAKARFW